ncbi:MAG TPA: hypothetical protein VND64_31845 [Pirellulales bacterium]|nr:hypothetical protein [Pirellulales bacterium]
MSVERTSKSLSERVEINFHHRPNRMRQLRWRWSLVALVLALVVTAVAAIRGDRQLYQAGPVSEAHQLIRNDCAKCHDEPWQPLARMLHFDDRRVSTSDKACGACHAGPKHHENQTGSSAHCAECHREHRDQAPLARVDDKACVHCHGDLAAHTGGSMDFATDIRDFASHPEFALKRKVGDLPEAGRDHKVRDVARPAASGGWEDMASIRFNHHKHLPADGLLRLDGSRQPLDCHECHQTDRDSGYMRPINHDQHCKRCHENERNFDYLRGAKQGELDRDHDNHAEAKNEWKADVAHGSVAQVHAKLIEFYTEYSRERPDHDPGPSADEVPREVPGRGPPLTEEGWAWVQAKVADAERLLLDNRHQHGCRYCHTAVVETKNGWEVEPPNIPARWLKHGKFRHDSHTLLACTQCHLGVDRSSETTDVLLPGIANCRECHAASPAGKEGVARTDCAECHDYHDRAGAPFHGRLSLGLQLVTPD